MDKAELNNQVIEVLKSCYDPEIPVNIYDLGLVYEIKVDDDSNVYIKMTLTSPMCPVAGSLPPEVENRIKKIQGVKDVRVDVVWEPMWGLHMMSDEAKLQLGL
jgi:FeS assembly SUF system protein